MKNGSSTQRVVFIQLEMHGNNSGSRRPLKTRMCVYNLAGRCVKGDNCGFAHHPEELNNPKQMLCPVAASTGQCCDRLCPLAHSPDELCKPKSLVKKKVCRYFAGGKCLAGEFCRHAHFVHELDSNASVAEAVSQEERKSAEVIDMLINMLTKSSSPISSASMPDT